MSNPLAIATVTATLHEVLTAALPASGVAGALVSALRPDDAANLPATGVNIFLFQVSPNTAWRNADLPTRRADGTLLRRPQAALDLHYLFTFYGNDAKFEQQRLLGAVVRQLHATPALARDVIRQVQTNIVDLNRSNLADQVDLVRLTPVNFSLEEFSKLWSVFLKTDYVLSVAYLASVVLIETDDPPPASALPVLRPKVDVFALSPAVIEATEPQPLEFSAAPPTQLTLIGRNLDPTADVMFTTPGSTDAQAGTIQAGGTSNQLQATLPAGLHAGVNLVRLVKTAPSAPHVLSQSNAAAFILQPTLTTITPGSPISVGVAPSVGPKQQVFLILNQTGVAAPQAFALPADPHGAETTTLTFSVPSGGVIPAGTYLARIRVDDAESRLQISGGTFNAPTVAIP
jgi:Pvc16 N-terminal domain